MGWAGWNRNPTAGSKTRVLLLFLWVLKDRIQSCLGLVEHGAQGQQRSDNASLFPPNYGTVRSGLSHRHNLSQCRLTAMHDTSSRVQISGQLCGEWQGCVAGSEYCLAATKYAFCLSRQYFNGETKCTYSERRRVFSFRVECRRCRFQFR